MSCYILQRVLEYGFDVDKGVGSITFDVEKLDGGIGLIRIEFNN